MTALLQFLIHPSTIAAATHLTLVFVISVRVIMLRPSTGTALAWLAIVSSVPFFGAAVYALFGERRISAHRRRGLEHMRTDFKTLAAAAINAGMTAVDWSRHDPSALGISKLGQSTTGSPTVHGSTYQLFSDTQEILQAITRDIDAAQKSLLIEFYIWNVGGAADEVLEAVIRAAKRGVSCRVLVDSLGARPWWKSKQPQALRDAGVEVQPALEVGIFRSFFGRTDLRLHRKIVVVDGIVAWTGSMNMVDPRVFKQGSGVGEWVDAMTRLEGAVVAPLGVTMIGDWAVETGEDIGSLVESAGLRLNEPQGSTDIQVIASGPVQTDDAILQMLLALVNAASEELVLTTPYLVPDESLQRAIRGAAGRGVRVAIVVPEKVDSFMTRHASRAFYEDLLQMGVTIYLYRSGLLHTKSITVDGALCMFGTVNLDMRSLWLNYEVAMFVYCKQFAAELRALQQTYIDDSDIIDPAEWAARPFRQRFVDNTLRLVGPLL